MAKAKNQKGSSVPNRILHSRISYLYQAASYLSRIDVRSKPQAAELKEDDSKSDEENVGPDDQCKTQPLTGVSTTQMRSRERIETRKPTHQPSTSTSNPNLPLGRHLLSHLHEVSLKSQVRLSPTIKHSICRRCKAPLDPTSGACSLRMENTSRGGRKPWADVLVLRCNLCAAERRFPVGAQRQLKRAARGGAEPVQRGPGEQPQQGQAG
ncbi:MAG: acid phosphatase pho5 [Chaenotheca gracillima]|nr:MAG: acid phosphatase pho5 [Chaenotheca gracillima]